MQTKRATSGWRSYLGAFVSRIRAKPTLAVVAMEGFLTRLGFSMVGFALPLYALSLGMNIAEIGFLFSLRVVVTILVKPVMGWAVDRFGSKFILTTAGCMRCVTGLLFVFATMPWHLYAIRILHGAMTAAREPSAAALIAEHGDKRSRASAFAWYTTARDLGRSLGYGAAGLLIQITGSYPIVFFIAFVTSCAALLTVVLYVREGQDAKDTPVVHLTSGPELVRHQPLYRGLWGYAVFGIMAAASAEMMYGLFPIIATQYAHLTEGQAGLAVSASAIIILVAGPLFGWFSDHVNRKLVLGTRGIANTVSSLLYVAFPNFPGVVVGRMVDDTGKAAFRPTWGAILAEVSDARPSHRARIMTFLDTAQSVGEVLGPLVAGLLLAGFGAPIMLGVRAVLSLTTEIHALWLFNRRSADEVGEGASHALAPQRQKN